MFICFEWCNSFVLCLAFEPPPPVVSSLESAYGGEETDNQDRIHSQHATGLDVFKPGSWDPSLIGTGPEPAGGKY